MILVILESVSTFYDSSSRVILYPQKREKEDTTHLTKSKSVMADNVLRVDTEPHIVANSSMVISKNSFSSKFRLIFLVGLEGTGHHYMADVLDRLCKISMIPCPNVCKMGKALYPGLGAPESANSYLAARRQLRQEMEYLANTANRMEEGKATMVGFGKCRNDMVGMMSYPNFNGIAKSVQYVDFRILAEEAERAGVDLRIIYLSRPARDVIVSDTKHNNYGETWVPILGVSHVLFMETLGAGSVFCLDFRFQEVFVSTLARKTSCGEQFVSCVLLFVGMRLFAVVSCARSLIAIA